MRQEKIAKPIMPLFWGLLESIQGLFQLLHMIRMLSTKRSLGILHSLESSSCCRISIGCFAESISCFFWTGFQLLQNGVLIILFCIILYRFVFCMVSFIICIFNEGITWIRIQSRKLHNQKYSKQNPSNHKDVS